MQKLGRYELGPVLGEGGAGRVYDAVLRGPGGFRKPVALKVLHSGSEDLRREARIGGLLRHRNLVDVYEIGEEDGRWFCALERCDGTLVDHAPLPERALREVALQVCAALQYAHEELGLVHLDIKPSNLLVSDGVVKVADLGIARAEGFEHDGRIRGTPSYMAPEQAAGMPVDPRADIYALGITLYDLAAGDPGAPAETLNMDDLADPSTLDLEDPARDAAIFEAPTLPEWLEPIIERCIAPDPRARWRDMAELADALSAVDADGPGLREAIGWTETAPVVAVGTNLGAERGALVGRDGEVAAVLEALEAPALVTLKGPAGIGKSRLAREVARRWHGRGREAWYVDLVEVTDADGLIAAVGWALGVPIAGTDRAARTAQVGAVLANRGEALVVFDNFEHLTDLARLVDGWTEDAPELRIVTTSRELLRLERECRVELAPLTVDAAVELMVDRAAERGAHVAGDPDLAALAGRLEGVPLALELAAGRLGVLSVRDVLDRLGLSLLRQAEGGRHGTLQAALDWSWELLGEVERSALVQLSAFAGGFTLEAAEGVLDLGGASVLDAVEALVDRSMCQALGNRFALLVSVQDYARAQQEDGPGLRRRHAAWFARYGTRDAVESLFAHGGTARRALLTADVDNLIAACRNAVADELDDLATPALAAAWAVLELRGPYDTGQELLDGVMSRRDTLLEPARAVALGVRILELASRPGDALALVEEGIALAVEMGDGLAAAEGRWARARVARLTGDPDALGLLEEALAAAEQVGHPRLRAHVLNGLGLALTRDDPERAEHVLTEALRSFQARGDRRGEGLSWGNLAGVWLHLGDLERAVRCTEAAVAMAREIGSRRSEGIWLGNLGVLMRRLGRPEEARQSYLAALEVHRSVGNRRHAGSSLGNLGRLAADEERLADARALTEQALEQVRAGGDRRSEAIWIANLGMLATREGNVEAGRSQIREAIALASEIGHQALVAELERSLAAVVP